MSGHTENQSHVFASSPAAADIAADIEVCECTTIDEFDACIRLQREVFGLPDVELSPRRHLVVSRMAGGFVLGAFARGAMVGFVHHLAAVRSRRIIGYSHMMAVDAAYQNRGVGARLKWAQRERALAEEVDFIKWTWEPMRARNAHFNINRLGVVVRSFAVNFYGTDYSTQIGLEGKAYGIDSDRLFAEWELCSPRVKALARGSMPEVADDPVISIEIPPNWSDLMRDDPTAARREQLRVRKEFQQAFAQGFVCAGFERDSSHPRYLFYPESSIVNRWE